MRVSLVLAALSALLLGASFAPVGLYPLAWFALVPLFWSLRSFKYNDRASELKGKRFARLFYPFALGYLFGFIFFLITVYWVVYSMYVYGGVSLPLSSLILLLLVAILALYPAIFAALFVLTSRRGIFLRLFLIPSTWVILEYLRGVLFTGFPWAFIGYSQARFTSIIQIADLFGIYGISFLIVLVNFAIYSILFQRDSSSEAGLLSGLRGGLRAVVLATLVLLTSTLAYGFIKIRVIDARLLASKSVKVAVAQGNIDQSVKWKPEFRLKTIDIYRELSLKAGGENAKLIVWPESAVPFYLFYEIKTGSLVRDVAIDTRSYLLTGSPHFEDNEPGSGEWENYYNSAFLLDPHGAVLGRYDKVKLVPFGEYVPLKRALFFIKKLTQGYADYTPGPGHMPITMEDLKLGVLICFESMFPDIASATVRNDASVLVVLTNDGWFGRTSAAYQHFDMSIFRAVENRVSLIRAANRGISGVIDPLGRVSFNTGLHTRELIVAQVKMRDAKDAKSFFTLYGRGFPLVLIIFFALSFFIKYDRR